jgi:hypothetical protein
MVDCAGDAGGHAIKSAARSSSRETIFRFPPEFK